MSTPLVVLRCMKPMYSSTPTITHPKKPMALVVSAAAAPVVNVASAMHAGIATIAVIMMAQTGACHLSLTYANFSGIILSNDIAKNVLEATRRNGGMSLETHSTPPIATIHESHCNPMPLAIIDAIPVLHAFRKLTFPRALIAAEVSIPDGG